LKHIHDSGYIHLDLKPANVLITFDGILKIADFGLASSWPAARNIDGEGDRHYLAPEALEGRYDKPGDIYALGSIMCEIAGNIYLPENGHSWQRLRSGDFSELPSLTWSSESSLNRDANGEPLSDPADVNSSTETVYMSETDEDPLRHITVPTVAGYTEALLDAPKFMIDENDPNSMHQLVKWMMHPIPDLRPTIDQVYRSYGCQWVEQRSRAGATIYEGNWGPTDDVLHHPVHVDDMMDMS
jgi:mitosis inhibitor protein kinase SWE1